MRLSGKCAANGAVGDGISANSHVPPHAHRSSVEVYVVRRGVCALVVNGELYEIGPGDVVLMEPGDMHELTNRGEEAFEVLVFKTNATENDTSWAEIDR